MPPALARFSKTIDPQDSSRPNIANAVPRWKRGNIQDYAGRAISIAKWYSIRVTDLIHRLVHFVKGPSFPKQSLVLDACVECAEIVIDYRKTYNCQF
jgi:hypothetical protein